MALVKVSQLTKAQKSVVESVPRGVKVVEGPAGTGKTTVGVRRMLRLLTKDKVFANEILVLVPQRTLATPYQDEVDNPKLDAGGRITVGTIGSLSRTAVDLFFPLIAEDVGFGRPNKRPVFLSLETAQYHMAQVAGPTIEERAYFDSIAITRNRLYSQIIDNLNKAAVVGFPYEEIATRLILAWGNKDRAQQTIYEQAQECAAMFRAYCLQHNLIDFSLQVELFRQLWAMPPVQNYFVNKYRHLIVDNIEEDTPITHDILLDWLPQAESVLLITDTDAGYRRFLGASPESAERLNEQVTTQRDRFTLTASDTFIAGESMLAFGQELGRTLPRSPNDDSSVPPPDTDPRSALHYDQPRYYVGMINAVAERIDYLIHEQNVPPDEIVVLAPFLSDSLRFLLNERLRQYDVITRSHRPSRALRDEPVAQAMLTWARIAHPDWRIPPTTLEITNALVSSIEGLDRVRAELIARFLFQSGQMQSFDGLATGLQERITYVMGEPYEHLRRWITDYQAQPLTEIDLFWGRLFGEVLSLDGFALHDEPKAGEVVANLMASAQKFRQMMAQMPTNNPIAQEYVIMVRDGLIGDQYLRSWQPEHETGVLLAPAYTFLMMNRPVDYQFWLNVGSSGWWERLYQPLTHPFVLTREWDWPIDGRVWSDEDEYYARNDTLYRVVLGLTRRCRREVYLGFSELGEQGYEQRGPLLGAVQAMLRRLSSAGEGEGV